MNNAISKKLNNEAANNTAHKIANKLINEIITFIILHAKAIMSNVLGVKLAQQQQKGIQPIILFIIY